MNQNIFQVYDEIASVLTAHITSWFGSKIQIETSAGPSIKKHTNSIILRYRVSGNSNHTILVKIPNRSPLHAIENSLADEALQKMAVEEFCQLEAIYTSLLSANHPAYAAIRPLTYLPEWNAIVMEELTASTLTSMINSPDFFLGLRGARSAVHASLIKAAGWLRFFHEHTGGMTHAPVNKDRMQARLEQIRENYTSHLSASSTAGTYLQRIKDIMDACSGMELSARQHGDFHCSNILVTPSSQVCALDPRTNPEKRSIYHDISSLIINLNYLQASGKMSLGFLKKCQRDIIENYFLPGEFSTEILNFYCASEVVFKWSNRERALVRGGRPKAFISISRPFIDLFSRQILHRFL